MAVWPRAMALVWIAAPRWTLVWAGLLLLQGVLPAVPVYLTRPLVDGLALALGGGGWQALVPLALPAALFGLTLLLIELVGSLAAWVRASQAELIQDHLSMLIHRQSLALDLSFYESPDYYDHLDRARAEAGEHAIGLLESGGALVQNGITLAAMAAILLPYGLWLPLVLLAGALPALVVVLIFDRRYHNWWHRTTTDRRWSLYFDAMLTHRDAAAEVRLFDLGAHFQEAHRVLRSRLRAERLQLIRVQSLARFGAGLLGLLATATALAWMVLRVVQGQLTLGDLALFYQAFQQGEGLLRTLLSSAGRIYQHNLFLSNLFAFLALRSRVSDPEAPLEPPGRLIEGITFRGVTFRYPGSTRPALNNFSLHIPAGKLVAIVGANGAGKSTLIKLLCRFYDPEDGAIELDGVDIRCFRQRDLWRSLSVLFQTPMQYHTSAAGNIALGQPETPQAAIEAAARAAGAHERIVRLPQGYATLLGRWFVDGAELSGGEWQRIATARAFLRQAPIIALDEPTSAMDSWAEADWFERLRALLKDRTGIIITHRFTIAMRADVIHVMDEGRIVESGSHHELLAAGGLYARSWVAQMEAAGHSEQALSR